MKPLNEKGAILITLIVVIVVIASLSASIISMSTISYFTEMNAGNSNKANYLAESAIRFAVSSNFSDTAGRTYTLSDGSKFYLRKNGNSIEVEGIVNENTSFESIRKFTYTSLGSVNPPSPTSDISFNDNMDGFNQINASIHPLYPGQVMVGDFDNDGNTEVKLYYDRNATQGKNQGAACMWYQGSLNESICDNTGICPFSKGIRVYFTIRVSRPWGSSHNLSGFTFAVLGADNNIYGSLPITAICGGIDQSNGYGGNNYDTSEESPVLAPKVAVEFDLSGDRRFGATLGTPGDPDPNHTAIIYWATRDKWRTDFRGCFFGANSYSDVYDDVIHGYGSAALECDPNRADKNYPQFNSYRLPNPGTTSASYLAVPPVSGEEWLEDDIEHSVRIEIRWDNANRELVTLAWVDCVNCDDLSAAFSGTCSGNCKNIADTRIIPSGLGNYMNRIRFGWTMGTTRDGEVNIENFMLKFIN
ncbi:MAG: hypothetical protein HQK76_09065 [Desulfobacterales bacterium]|nr:hypothetical protein [Desulfobacterales bacterium]